MLKQFFATHKKGICHLVSVWNGTPIGLYNGRDSSRWCGRNVCGKTSVLAQKLLQKKPLCNLKDNGSELLYLGVDSDRVIVQNQKNTYQDHSYLVVPLLGERYIVDLTARQFGVETGASDFLIKNIKSIEPFLTQQKIDMSVNPWWHLVKPGLYMIHNQSDEMLESIELYKSYTIKDYDLDDILEENDDHEGVDPHYLRFKKQLEYYLDSY